MQQVAEASTTLEAAHPGATTIITTLHDLIEAINEEILPEEDHMVAEIVLDPLDRGRIRFLNPLGELVLLWPAT